MITPSFYHAIDFELTHILINIYLVRNRRTNIHKRLPTALVSDTGKLLSLIYIAGCLEIGLDWFLRQ